MAFGEHEAACTQHRVLQAERPRRVVERGDFGQHRFRACGVARCRAGPRALGKGNVQLLPVTEPSIECDRAFTGRQRGTCRQRPIATQLKISVVQACFQTQRRRRTDQANRLITSSQSFGVQADIAPEPARCPGQRNREVGLACFSGPIECRAQVVNVGCVAVDARAGGRGPVLVARAIEYSEQR